MKYGTVVADPPWQYRKSARRGDENHSRNFVDDLYPSMTMKEIAALPIADLAADNAHLYLWATNPRLFSDRPPADDFGPFQIMRAWGFRYVTMLSWIKQGSPGMGSYFRIDTEHILFGVRGTCPIAPSERISNVIYAPKSRHSAKPESFLDVVERVSPGPYLELFARRNRMGWSTWGNEVISDVAI